MLQWHFNVTLSLGQEVSTISIIILKYNSFIIISHRCKVNCFNTRAAHRGKKEREVKIVYQISAQNKIKRFLWSLVKFSPMHCFNCFLCIMAVKSKSVRHIVYQYSQDEHSVNTGRSKETLGIISKNKNVMY